VWRTEDHRSIFVSVTLERDRSVLFKLTEWPINDQMALLLQRSLQQENGADARFHFDIKEEILPLIIEMEEGQYGKGRLKNVIKRTLERHNVPKASRVANGFIKSREERFTGILEAIEDERYIEALDDELDKYYTQMPEPNLEEQIEISYTDSMTTDEQNIFGAALSWVSNWVDDSREKQAPFFIDQLRRSME